MPEQTRTIAATRPGSASARSTDVPPPMLQPTRATWGSSKSSSTASRSSSRTYSVVARGGAAVAAHVVADHPVLRRECREHAVPDRRVRDPGMQQHHRLARPAGIVRPELVDADPNHRLHNGHSSTALNVVSGVGYRAFGSLRLCHR